MPDAGRRQPYDVRVPWATLMRRSFAIDTLVCPACGGRLRLLSTITERATVRKLLEHLGIPERPPMSMLRG